MSKHRIGCNTIDPLLQVRDGSDYTPEVTRRALEFVAASGFECVEYSHYTSLTDRDLDAVREMAGQVGLAPWSMHAVGLGDVTQTDGARKAEKTLANAARVALGLGVRYVVQHTCGRTVEGGGADLVQHEADIFRAAWSPGMLWALETETSMAHMEYLLAIVDEIGSEMAGINVDSGHPNLGRDLGVGQAIRLAGHRLITTHLHDNHGATDEHAPPGDGNIDWEDVAAALREVGYQGCIMCELTDQPSPERRARGVAEELPRAARMARWIADKLDAPG